MKSLGVFRAIASQDEERAQICRDVAGWASTTKKDRRVLLAKAKVFNAAAKQIKAAIRFIEDNTKQAKEERL